MMRPEPDPAAGQLVPAKPPAPVTAAQVMLALGAILLLWIAAVVYLNAGQNAEAWGRASVYGFPAILMLVVAVLLGRGRRVARWLAVVAGALMLFFGLGGLGRGGLLYGLLLTIFSLGAIVNVSRRPARAWFRRPDGAP